MDSTSSESSYGNLDAYVDNVIQGAYAIFSAETGEIVECNVDVDLDSGTESSVKATDISVIPETPESQQGQHTDVSTPTIITRYRQPDDTDNEIFFRDEQGDVTFEDISQEETIQSVTVVSETLNNNNSVILSSGPVVMMATRTFTETTTVTTAASVRPRTSASISAPRTSSRMAHDWGHGHVLGQESMPATLTTETMTTNATTTITSSRIQPRDMNTTSSAYRTHSRDVRPRYDDYGFDIDWDNSDDSEDEDYSPDWSQERRDRERSISVSPPFSLRDLDFVGDALSGAPPPYEFVSSRENTAGVPPVYQRRQSSMLRACYCRRCMGQLTLNCPNYMSRFATGVPRVPSYTPRDEGNGRDISRANRQRDNNSDIVGNRRRNNGNSDHLDRRRSVSPVMQDDRGSIRRGSDDYHSNMEVSDETVYQQLPIRNRGDHESRNIPSDEGNGSRRGHNRSGQGQMTGQEHSDYHSSSDSAGGQRRPAGAGGAGDPRDHRNPNRHYRTGGGGSGSPPPPPPDGHYRNGPYRRRRRRYVDPRIEQERLSQYLMARTLDLLNREERGSQRRSGSKKEPMTFSGTSDNLIKWIDEMDLYFNVNDIEERKKGAIAKQYLSETALLVIKGHELSLRGMYNPQYQVTWMDICQKLKAEFASGKAKAMLESTWNRRIQQPKETVMDYVNTMRDIGHRLNKSEVEIVNKIKATLKPGLDYFVSTEDPQTVAQLLISAQRLEDAGVANLFQKGGKVAKTDVVKQEVCSSDPGSQGVTMEQVETLQAPMKSSIDKLTSQIKQLQVKAKKTEKNKDSNDKQTEEPKVSQESIVKEQQFDHITCYGCGQRGHYKTSCPNKGKEQYQKQTENQNDSDRYQNRRYQNRSRGNRPDRSRNDLHGGNYGTQQQQQYMPSMPYQTMAYPGGMMPSYPMYLPVSTATTGASAERDTNAAMQPVQMQWMPVPVPPMQTAQMRSINVEQPRSENQ